MAAIIKITVGCILVTTGIIGLFVPVLPGMIMIGVGAVILNSNRK